MRIEPGRTWRRLATKALAFAISASAAALSPCAADAQDADRELLDLLSEQRLVLQRQAEQIERLERRVEELEREDDTAVAEAQPTPAAAIEARQDSPRTYEVGRLPDDSVVRVGEFDGAITIPGTDLSMRLGGLVQADAILGDDDIGSRYAFVARSIVEDGEEDWVSRVTARRTRFNLDVRGESAFGEFRTFIEADFDGEGGEEFVANGSSLRLRHAFGQLGPLYVGQYWSGMADPGAYPETLDTVGPAGRVGARQAGVRYVGFLSPRVRYVIGLENAEGDVNGGAVQTVDRAPDLVANIGWENDWAHLRLASVARWLTVEGASRDQDETGWGLNLTGRLLMPGGAPRDNVVFGIVGGDGVGRYVMEFAGGGYDGFVSAAGEFETFRVLAGYLGYQHWWSRSIRSTLTVGAATAEMPEGAPGPLVESVATGSMNLLWNPVEQVTVGAELQWGRQEERDGASAEASRLQLTARHQF